MDVGGDELVQVDVRQLQQLLDKLGDRGKNLQPVLPTLAEVLVTAVEDEFQTEGHGQWPPLAASTLRQRRGTSAQILQDTGRLAGSIQPDYESDWVAAGTDVEYAIYHVSSRPRTKIPKRDFLDVATEDVLAEMSAHLTEYLVGRF